MKIKEEDMYNYDSIDIEEFKIEPDNNINEIKEVEFYDYDQIDIEEFKISNSNSNVNEIEYKDESDKNNVNAVNNLSEINNIDEEVVDNIDENVNEVEGNVVDQGNNGFQGLENLSVAEALAFFSL